MKNGNKKQRCNQERIASLLEAHQAFNFRFNKSLRLGLKASYSLSINVLKFIAFALRRDIFKERKSKNQIDDLRDQPSPPTGTRTSIRQTEARRTVVIVMAVPVALPGARIKLQIIPVRQGGVRGLAAGSAPERIQVRIRSTVTHTVTVEIGGCAGVAHSHVGILHTGQRTFLEVILIG